VSARPLLPAVRPRVELLSRPLVEQIIDEALTLLGTHGVLVENEEALTLFREADQDVDASSGRVYVKRELVEQSLRTAPSSVTLYDRSGRSSFLVGGDEVHFDPGSAAVTILDGDGSRARRPQTADLVRFVRLTDALPHLHFQSTGLVSGDVPETMADFYRLYIGLLHSSKPVVTGTFRAESFGPMRDLLAAVRGSEKALAEKPLAIFDACPSPPLKWSRLTTQSLLECSRAMIPSELISMGMTGATSPVTLSGTLVQHAAENLAGLVICQLARPGAPVIFGGSPSSFDMRKGTTPMGAVETMMIDMAYAQVAKHLRLPTHAYMGLSDAKVNDSQAGLETGLGAVLAALAGINVVSGAGMMNFESCQSLEKLVIDDEICGMAYRLIRGVAHREDPMAIHLYEAAASATNFLALPHTRRWYRQEHTYPVLADRDTHDAWAAQGRKTMADRASDLVVRILKEHQPELPPEETLRSLRDIATRAARGAGMAALPLDKGAGG
jgi:trimethylamine--corrinoid protein Co-methyltransferase